MPDVNSVFVYNADAIDGTTDAECIAGINTYNDNISIQSLTFLNENLAPSMYFNNGNITPESIPTTDSGGLEEVNHFSHARFRDGTPLSIGGNGYNPASSDATQYVFPGNPSNSDEWSMFQEGLNVGDRRSIVATSDFDFGESRSFSFAFTTHPSSAPPQIFG